MVNVTQAQEGQRFAAMDLDFQLKLFVITASNLLKSILKDTLFYVAKIRLRYK